MIHRPMRVLVTGGAGFIGANFVRYLLAGDPQVQIVTLDLLTYAGRIDNLAALPDESRHRLVIGDICDRPLVDALLREHAIDTIVHFAAESHVDRSIAGPGEFVRTNVVSTSVLLEAARQYWFGEQRLDAAYARSQRRFHHIGTDEVYGSLAPDDPPFSESTRYAPNSPYSASKAASDHLVRAYWHTYGLPVTTTNCSNNYGPHQHNEKFIPTVISSCLNQKPIPVYGNGSNIRDWLFVDDHCSAIDNVVRRGATGETYNVGGCNEWKNIDIVRLICALMDEYRPAHAPHARLVEFVTDRAGHDWRYAIDARKIINGLGWRPNESFESGIRKTLSWNIRQLELSAAP